MKKITLKNLHEATAQEVFDQCAVHLLTQKEKAVVEHKGCRYKHENLKCAAGCFIDESEYDPSMEGVDWTGLVNQGKVTASHKDLIYELQRVHDICPAENWRTRLIELSRQKELNNNAINNLN